MVVFDPSTVGDVATELEPHPYPRGIDQVIVNGVQAIVDGEETGRTGGSAAAAGGMKSSVESPERIELAGGPLTYILRRSHRARRLRLVVDPARASS